MKKYLLLLFLLLPAFAFTQTAAELDTLLETEAVTVARAARFVLEAAELLPAGLSAAVAETAAYGMANSRGWTNKRAGDAVTLQDTAFLVMNAFDFKGGLMYTIFRSPRYAYRELIYNRIIQGRSYRVMTVSGPRLLQIIGRSLVHAGEEDSPVRERLSREQETALVQEIGAQLTAQSITDAGVAITNEGVTINLSNIQFLADSAVLTETEQRRLVEIAQILNAVSARRIMVSGHAAPVGNPQELMQLSWQRAQAVADYLVFLGARNHDEIVVVGYGIERLLTLDTSPAGLNRNRRVEITIMGQQ